MGSISGKSIKSQLSSNYGHVYKTISSSTPELSSSPNYRDVTHHVTGESSAEQSRSNPDVATLNPDELAVTITEGGSSSDDQDDFGISSISAGSNDCLERYDSEFRGNSRPDHVDRIGEQ